MIRMVILLKALVADWSILWYLSGWNRASSDLVRLVVRLLSQPMMSWASRAGSVARSSCVIQASRSGWRDAVMRFV